ncbi:restriction system protein [Alkalibacillus filiformis]|uniref:Restriction system protein n=1 Tax=Alkalibacillus filiformis TaxID=200990 RepID=A0ABU0DUA9_9BACI|nr:restriction endonuclease [Alkalibacillus filiformis]MDQ0352042.1 restriction system protein [Alkalibacillus filiformis]
MNKRKNKKTDPLLIGILIGVFVVALTFDLLKWTFNIPGIAWVATAGILGLIYFARTYLNERKRARIIEYRRQYLQKHGDLEQLKQMSPSEFEQYISDLFVQMGYNAFVTEPNGMPCEDLIVSFDDFFATVVCRNGESITVTPEEIKKCESSLEKSNASIAFFITTGDFEEQIHSQSVKLINGQDLMKLINEVTAETKGGQLYQPLKLLHIQ